MKRRRKPTRKELKKQIKILQGHLESRAFLHREDVRLLRKFYDSRGSLPPNLLKAIEARFQTFDRAWIRAADCPAIRKTMLDSIFTETPGLQQWIRGDWNIITPKDLP